MTNYFDLIFGLLKKNWPLVLVGGLNGTETSKIEKKFLGKIPIDIDLRSAADTGKPLFEKNPEHKTSKIFKEIANKIKLSFQ